MPEDLCPPSRVTPLPRMRTVASAPFWVWEETASPSADYIVVYAYLLDSEAVLE